MSVETTQVILIIAMLAIMLGLFLKRFKPTAVFAFVVLALVVLKIIPLPDLLEHMANSSVITIFLLIFITASLKEHFNLIGVLDRIFIGIKRPRVFLASFGTMVSGLSSIVNNTPIVALFIPYIIKWAKRKNVSPSKFLIPLSFAATLGGTITLIGTSTNLVLNGLMTSNGFEAFTFTDFLVPGLLVTFFGLILLVTLGFWLLPEHKDLLEEFEINQRKYIVEMLVSADSPLINKTVESAELRNLEGVYLVEIFRNNKMISPVAPNEILLANDLLYFVGDTNNVAELINNQSYGLVLPKTEKFDLGNELDLVEALIPAMSDLGGKKVNKTNFRERYDAAIVAIQRDGQKLGGKIGDQELQYGDLLLLTAGKKFAKKVRAAKNLYSLSSFEFNNKENQKGKKIFGVILAIIIAAIMFNYLSLLVGLLIIQASLFALKLADFGELKRQFNPDLYIILVSAIAFSTALIKTGTANLLTDKLMIILYGAPSTVIGISLFLITIVLTSFVTNVAAVSIMFPITAAILPQLNLLPTDAFLLIAFGASCSFLTPISYQTNIMVYEPGGYSLKDFLKIGLPLTILYSLICIAYFLMG